MKSYRLLTSLGLVAFRSNLGLLLGDRRANTFLVGERRVFSLLSSFDGLQVTLGCAPRRELRNSGRDFLVSLAGGSAVSSESSSSDSKSITLQDS